MGVYCVDDDATLRTLPLKKRFKQSQAGINALRESSSSSDEVFIQSQAGVKIRQHQAQQR